MFRGALGVRRWEESTGAVAGESLPLNGAFSIADPRFDASSRWNDGRAYGVRRWDESTGAIAGQQTPGQGAYSVADPRHHGPAKHSNEFRIVRWAGAAQAVTGAHGSGQCIADPRPGMQRSKGDHYLTGGHYGVVQWGNPCGAVSAAAGCDNGRWSIADPRMPAATDKIVCRIRALDGTWHRPFTTLELAALQGLVDPEEQLELDGLSDSAWRERIGNAVPPPAAQAIASEMGRALLLAWSGETFRLSSTPVWVRPIAVALRAAA